MRPCKLFPFSRVELQDLKSRARCGPENVEEMLKNYREEQQLD